MLPTMIGMPSFKLYEPAENDPNVPIRLSPVSATLDVAKPLNVPVVIAPAPLIVPFAFNETDPLAVPPVEIAPGMVMFGAESATVGALSGPATVSVPPNCSMVKPPPPETVNEPIVSIPAEIRRERQ